MYMPAINTREYNNGCQTSSFLFIKIQKNNKECKLPKLLGYLKEKGYIFEDLMVVISQILKYDIILDFLQILNLN